MISVLIVQFGLHVINQLAQTVLKIGFVLPGVISTLVCANKVRNGPANTDQGRHFTASQGSRHVYGRS